MSKRIIVLALLSAGFIAGPVGARTWVYDGAITSCNAGICDLVPIAVGNPVVGVLVIDVDVNDSFTLDSTFAGFDFLVGDPNVAAIPVLPFPGSPGPDGISGTADDFWVEFGGAGSVNGGTTNAVGDFLTGDAGGTFFGGTLGALGGGVFICFDAAGCGTYSLNAGTFTGTLEQGDFLVTVASGTTFVAEVEGTLTQVDDGDSDGVADEEDNCTLVANASQRDTDGDNIGNDCDADVNTPINDCLVDFLDLLVYRANFFQPGDFDTDNNGDNITDFLDLFLVRAQFFGPPGPSGLPDDCDPAD